jgi:lysophospholipase L1-like esterase
MIKKETTIKLVLFFSSLLVSLVMLEIILRLMGGYISSEVVSTEHYNTDEFYEVYLPGKEAGKKTESKIFCIGDSFTNGGNFQKKWSENYPHHLSQLLEKENTHSTVLNLGLCEDTTFGVYERLKTIVKSAKIPQGVQAYLVVLVGSADTFHSKAEQEHSKTRWFVTNENVLNGFKPWYYGLRVYKAFRHIKYSLSHLYLLWTTEKSRTAHLWNNSEEYFALVTSQKNKEAQQLLLESIMKIKSSDYFAKLSKNKDEFYKDLINPLVNSVVNAHLERGDYKTALEKILLIGSEFPEAWEIYAMRYLSFQMYLKQSVIPASKIIDSLIASKDVFESVEVQKFYHQLSRAENIEREVDKKRLNIWSKIIELVKTRDIQLIIQNYPSAYNNVNNLLERIAKENNIPFVDNRSVFKKLIKKNGRSKYLKGDDHCTDLGYKIMAENVEKVIREFENQN